MATPDPYKILGVDRTASQDDIKKAYRKLAKTLHPDLNPGNESVEKQFKDVSQAYGILGDPDRRKRFDRGEIDASGQETPFGSGFYQQQARGRGRSKYQPNEFADAFGGDDVFSDLFRGFGGGRTIRRKGADVSYTAPVSFLDAALGTTKRLKLADGKTLDVKLPPGTRDRQTFRLKGQGLPGVGGAPAGDALVEVEIQPHSFFKREDGTIRVELPITLQEAISGGSVTVPTIHGGVSMRIPPGSNSGSVLRLRGKGIEDPKSGTRGDQLVTLKVMLPERPDEELRRFIDEWSKTHSYDPRRKAGLN